MNNTDSAYRSGWLWPKRQKKGDIPMFWLCPLRPFPEHWLSLFMAIWIYPFWMKCPKQPASQTYLIDPPKRERAYGFIRKHLDAGEQAYVVCPLVEQGENSPEGLDSGGRIRTPGRDFFSGYKVGMLHGRMKAAEKEQIMKDFQSGELQLLVSTTVIEVGVDVPNATVMLIQNAERFGPFPTASAARTGGTRRHRILLHSGFCPNGFSSPARHLSNK